MLSLFNPFVMNCSESISPGLEVASLSASCTAVTILRTLESLAVPPLEPLNSWFVMVGHGSSWLVMVRLDVGPGQLAALRHTGPRRPHTSPNRSELQCCSLLHSSFNVLDVLRFLDTRGRSLRITGRPQYIIHTGQ